MEKQLLFAELPKELTDSTAEPAWAYGAVIYQIFTDRFFDAVPANDVRTNEYTYGLEYETGPIPIEHAEWNSGIHMLDVGRFYGGDLQGVLDKLDYLKTLGIEAIYLNPIFCSPSNHKYDVSDYEHIDPHLTTGDLATTNAFFTGFVQTLHNAGIRVILDGVFNHCSSRHPFFQEAMQNPQSPYREYFRFDEAGKPEYWWGVPTLPKFNYEGSRELEDYMMKIAAMWVSPPYCCDGWRLDVGADLGHSEAYNHQFWKRFRETVRKANPQAIVLAEHYGDPSAWIRNGEWDTVMNYDGFMDPVSYYLTGMEKHSDKYNPSLEANAAGFWSAAKKAMRQLSTQSAVAMAMNQLDNHDHSRMITRTAKIPGRLGLISVEAASENVNYGLYRAAAVMLMTWPGCPTLYYGDETAVPGWTDPDSRRVYPWDKMNFEMIDFFQWLIDLHKQEVFRYGSLSMLPVENADAGEKHTEENNQIIAYERSYQGNAILVIINPTNGDHQVKINVGPEYSEAVRVLNTTDQVVSLGTKKARKITDGTFLCHPMQYSAKMYWLVHRK